MEVNDAVPKPMLVQQLQLEADVGRQRPFAASHHNRYEEQMAFVDQPGADRLSSQGWPTDGNVAARVLFEPAHGLGIEAALDPSLGGGDGLKRV